MASKILLGLAVLLGALAFVFVRGYEQRAAAVRPAGASVPVAVAAIDLTRGTQLVASMLGVSTVPASALPPGAVSDPAAIIGRVLTGDIAGGEILTASRLSTPRSGPIAALVPPGLRAMVIAAGVPTGSVRAGDRIDVYATYGGGRPHTELAASAIEVLRVLSSAPTATGIGGAGTGSADAGVGLVVLVDTDAAERLAYARTFAQLTVAILGADPATGSP